MRQRRAVQVSIPNWRDNRLPHVTLPVPDYQMVRIFADRAKMGTSSCKICGKGISRRGKRIGVLYQARGAATTPSGAYVPTRRVSYMHASCFKRVLGLTNVKAEGPLCWDCSKPSGDTGRVVRGGLGYQHEVLCDTCFASGRWAACRWCGLYNMIADTSLTTEAWGSLSVNDVICDRCAGNTGVATVKQEARRRRAEEQFADKYSRVVDRLLRGEF